MLIEYRIGIEVKRGDEQITPELGFIINDILDSFLFFKVLTLGSKSEPEVSIT